MPTINGGSTSDTRIPYDRQIAPYTKNDQIFACPSDHETRSPATDGGLQFWDGTYRDKALIRSYSYVATVDTAQVNGRDANSGLSTYVGNVGINGTPPAPRSMADIDRSSDTIGIVESWPAETNSVQDSAYVGSSHGSGFVGCDTWKLAGRVVGTSPATDANSLQPTCNGNAGKKATVGHSGGSNYMMADGSAKWRTWKQVRQNDMYLFKLQKPATTVTP